MISVWYHTVESGNFEKQPFGRSNEGNPSWLINARWPVLFPPDPDRTRPTAARSIFNGENKNQTAESRIGFAGVEIFMLASILNFRRFKTVDYSRVDASEPHGTRVGLLRSAWQSNQQIVLGEGLPTPRPKEYTNKSRRITTG